MAKYKSISYGKQSIEKSDIISVSAALKSDFLTQGDTVPLFERAIADYVGAKYAVAVSSGTAALHIAYLALGLTAGDEVITSPITFAATANAALYTGAKPVFVDIDPKTALIDISKIEAAITPRTKAIAPIHYAGLPCDMAAIGEVAKRYNLSVVEDACHALGGKSKNERVGGCRFSDMSAFSFHPVKHITTGEGGAVTTNNEELYKKLVMLRSHGITKTDLQNEPTSPTYAEMQMLGYNYRLTDFQAALGFSQMKRLDRFIKRRTDIASYYTDTFKKTVKIELLESPQGFNHAYHLFPILLPNRAVRDALYAKLYDIGIRTQIHYIPVHKQPYYQSIGYADISMPFSENYYSRTLSLPIYPKMLDSDMQRVAAAVLKILKGK